MAKYIFTAVYGILVVIVAVMSIYVMCQGDDKRFICVPREMYALSNVVTVTGMLISIMLVNC